MNPAWVETARAAVSRVLHDCGLGAGQVGTETPVTTPVRVADAVGVAIDLRGDRQGCLGLLFPKRDAAGIAQGVFSLDSAPDTAEELDECLAEIANLIAGHVVGGLVAQGLDLDLSTPRVLPGPDPEAGFPPGAEACILPIATNRGGFLLIFSLSNLATGTGAGPGAAPLHLTKETPMSELRVLVVDDSRVARSVVVRAFQQHGCEVVGLAENGVQAIEMFQRLRPDLVTLDLVMPEMDGVQALKQIKQIDPKARIIVVSSVGKKETVVDCIRNGAANYLLKPFDPVRVGEVLAQCFPGRFNRDDPDNR